jgi:pre-mRNA-processing factor 40
MNAWTTHSTPDGREYYYNTITRVTTWEKPTEIKTPLEVTSFRLYQLALEKSDWTMHSTPDGKKYFHNKSILRNLISRK